MKKLLVLGVSLVLLIGLVIGWDSVRRVGAQIMELIHDDPDIPSRLQTGLSKEEFMMQRAEGIAMKRGIHKDQPFDPQPRIDGVNQLQQQELKRLEMPASRAKNSLLAVWSPIGPAPIPNAQVGTGPSTTASGRVSSIAIHPTNPDIVYVGTAQGGLYRSTNGGTDWTPIMDSALSLAIGAIAIAPSQPETIYVGTGEPGFCGSCFFGVGVYRIDNASGPNPILSGPLNDDAANVDIFSGRAIGEIVVHPTDAATIFVASTSGIGGIGANANNVLPARGLYRSTDATSADPTFIKLAVAGALPDNFSIRDVAIDPINPNFLVVWLVANNGGIYVAGNALSGTPTFSHPPSGTFSGGSTSELNGEIAIHHQPGPANPTIYVATGNGAGGLLVNTDGGSAWTLQNSINFCSPQCFYDIAVAVDPTNAANVYLGGSPNLVFGRSTNGGVLFTDNSQTAQGLHVDSHAIAIAPSLPSTIYFGSDGGIYKSIDSGSTWMSLNNGSFSATQFMSIAVHPSDPNFTIGGTQDNGTNFYRPNGTWFMVDGGDGGYAAIDQNATDTSAVTMYHTYFNRTEAMGYARTLNTTSAENQLWSLHGCGFFGSIPNGMTCSATATLFYAPLEIGPGNPNSLYFGSDVLYRSADGGTTMTKVSEEPIQSGVAISAIGIAPQNDNIRIVGQNNGNLFGTSTGSSTLTNLDPLGHVPANFIARAAINPSNANTAYVTLSAFGLSSVWKTTNLSGASPNWIAAANGLPQVPVSAFIIDPLDPNTLYAGTDIGVFTSTDGGANWLPFGTGLPRVAVFDMAITNGAPRKLRIATHGRGMWEIAASTAFFSLSGRVATPDGRGLRNALVTITNSNIAQNGLTSSFGFYQFDEVPGGATYTITVRNKRYRFSSRVEAVNSSLAGIDFIGQE